MRLRPAGFEERVLLLALTWPLPTVVITVALLWTSDQDDPTRWVGSGFVLCTWLAGAFVLKRRAAHSLQIISSLLAALKGGDFSVRGRVGQAHDALDEALSELNSLATILASQRAGALEASALLRKVISQIDVAIFAFDRHRKLKLVNDAGERLLGRPASRLMGESAAAIDLEAFLEGEAPRTTEVKFAGGQGHWELRRAVFRMGGLPHELLVLTNVHRALREEERQAWQRLVRVLGHEINNSLAPIHAIARDMRETLRRPSSDRASDWQDDLERGAAVIERRSEALGRFMISYGRLARLPPPRFGSVDVGSWIRRAVELEKRLAVGLDAGPDLTIAGDADQLEQMLINLIQNAVDAALETGGGVDISWRMVPGQVEITVADEGPGIADTHNLFVPFFTTKPNGSGIGLALSRQIVEAHGGTLSLEPRVNRPGAVATLRLRRT